MEEEDGSSLTFHERTQLIYLVASASLFTCLSRGRHAWQAHWRALQELCLFLQGIICLSWNYIISKELGVGVSTRILFSLEYAKNPSRVSSVSALPAGNKWGLVLGWCKCD